MGKHIILGREKVLVGQAFDVERVHFQLPDGRQRSYDLVDHANAVTLVPVSEVGEIYFVSQYRVGSESLLLELPAGVLDPGEAPLISARRELREEIGMDAAQLFEIGNFYMSPGYSNEFMSVFLAMELHPAPLARDEDEFLEIMKIPVEQIYQMALSGEILDGKSLTALLFALPFLKNAFPDQIISLCL